MQRRQFIKLTSGCAAGTILVPSIFSGCSNTESVALEGWQKPPLGQKDIRIVVLSYAILASNPHNKQPWLIDLHSHDQFDLYVDQDRLLPETDPPFRQVHIGQGTFLENLSLAARAYGYRAKIEYFPKGMYSNATIEKKPVATITLAKQNNISSDPLFDDILTRQSNKRVYEETPLTDQQVNVLLTSYETDDYEFHITQDPALRKKIADLLGKAMEVETLDDERHIETAKMFRLNSEEIEKYRDGFSLAQLGMTGIKGWVAENFFLGSRQEEEDPNSDAAIATKKITIEKTSEQAKSAAAFGWIVSKSNTRLDQVKIGRAYQRVNLMATRLGLGQHPMSQILQEYDDMADLQKEFLQTIDVPETKTVQMLFRFGSASVVPHSPRRKINDMLIG